MSPFFQYSYSQRLCFFCRDISWVADGLWKKLFVRFERTFNGVVFDDKNSAGNHCAFAGERLKHSENFTFLNTRFGGHGLKD